MMRRTRSGGFGISIFPKLGCDTALLYVELHIRLILMGLGFTPVLILFYAVANDPRCGNTYDTPFFHDSHSPQRTL